MNAKTNNELMARYNQWMNNKVLKACSTLSAEALELDRGAFFHSILGTLNHIFVGDTLWLKRFAHHPSGYEALLALKTTPTPASLNVILYDDLATFAAARKRLDETILVWSKEVSADDLGAPFHYENSSGQTFENNFGEVVQHFFNHQTHHRGQLTTLLSQAQVDVGSTDLIAFMRQ